MSESNGLPKGWVEATIEDLVGDGVFCDGDWVESEDQDPNGDVRLIQLADVGDGEYRDRSSRFLTSAKAKELNCTFLQEGDLLIARMPDPLGRSALFPGDAKRSVTVVDVCIVRGSSKAGFSHKWLMHFINSPRFRVSVASLQSGSTRKRISRTNLASLSLPVPPLPEQHRIVEQIEELFSDLDAGIASLQRAKANLKRYRASVLKSAVEGRLTGQAPFPHKRFEELIDGLSQGWSPKCELTREPDENEWAIIKTTAVQSLAYSDREAKPLPDSLEPRPHLEICEGDFLMTRKGPRQRAGVACLVRHTRPRLMVCDTVYRFRCRPEIVSPAYLEIALNTPVVIEAIDRLKSGINDSGVSLTHNKLYAVPIPLPPLAEQEQIVALVEERLSQIDSAEKTIDAELIRSKRLRQSILKSAFEGKLVPQNPKDEPASVLLERIKASREAEQPKKKANKATKVKAR